MRVSTTGSNSRLSCSRHRKPLPLLQLRRNPSSWVALFSTVRGTIVGLAATDVMVARSFCSINAKHDVLKKMKISLQVGLGRTSKGAYRPCARAVQSTLWRVCAAAHTPGCRKGRRISGSNIFVAPSRKYCRTALPNLHSLLHSRSHWRQALEDW